MRRRSCKIDGEKFDKADLMFHLSEGLSIESLSRKYGYEFSKEDILDLLFDASELFDTVPVLREVVAELDDQVDRLLSENDSLKEQLELLLPNEKEEKPKPAKKKTKKAVKKK